jgi:hypothetical protein
MTQKIKPEYATFEHAKWLKELGFIEFCNMRYNEFGKLTATKLGMHANPNNYVDSYSAPEQWQVVEWLRVNHGIWVWVEKGRNPENFYPAIDSGKEIASFKHLPKMWRDTPQQAYSAAFDYIFNEWVEQNK